MLTDNEPAQGYSATLQQRLAAINTAGASVQGYRPMQVTVTPVTAQQEAVTLGGVLLKVTHQPSYTSP